MPGWIIVMIVVLFIVGGVLSAFDAIMQARTPQGATAWVLALVAMPFLALPLYWIFGRAKFDEYVRILRRFDEEVNARLEEARGSGPMKAWLVEPEQRADDVRTQGELSGFQDLSTLYFTRGNQARLLVDGAATFEAIFAGIDAAREYVLAQFYIIHDDDLGRAFQQKLIDAAKRGVRVYLIYDEIGCYHLPKSYKKKLREAGVAVSGFSGRRNWLGRFRLNFRNHRKIVVVDGKLGFVGGLNVGDEYLGKDPVLTPWRDTHLALEGPAVQGLQLSFVRDWFYGRQETPEVRWRAHAGPADQPALVLASGPADTLETCGLLYTHAIESAERRVWIASPYFVPDGRVLGALQLAALRGVDVRVLMPRQTDSVFFKYVPYAYLPEVEQAGVEAFLYEDGFMHQKVMLVDDDYAAVGTANFDNRSFRYNFEVTCLVNDPGFCEEVAAMLEQDFARATPLRHEDFADQSVFFSFAVQSTRLLAPLL